MPPTRTARWWRPLTATCLPIAGLWLSACSPTVKMQAPKEPIVINLNIKLDAEVRVKLEEAARQDIKDHPDIF